MTAIMYVAIGLFIFVSLILILLVLIQKGRGGGLASAFGGSGGNTAFGSKTGDVLTWATSIIFGIFILLAVVLNLMANHQTGRASATVVTPTQQNTPSETGASGPTPTSVPASR